MRLLRTYTMTVIIVTLGMVGAAQASPIYVEDFLGESTYPTTPEVDTMGLGGLSGFSNGDGPPPLPVIDGVAGTVLMAAQGATGPAPESAGLATFTSALNTAQNLTAGGTYSNFDSIFEGIGAVQLGLGLTDEFAMANAGAILSNIPGLMEIVILEQTLGVAGNDQLRVAVSDAVRIAILDGALFEIELRMNRDQGRASAALIIGAVEIVTPDLILSRFGTQGIRFVDTQAFVHDFIGTDQGANDSLSVVLHELRMASVPEPGTFGLLGAGLIGLAWRRRRAA